MTRKAIPTEVRTLVLHEAGYLCGNPRCRTPLTLEIHHLVQVATGGASTADNLICLCPNCHTSHHNGRIPIESLRTWKHLLLTLNAAYDKASIDTLLVLHQLQTITISGDALLQRGGLLASGLIEIGKHVASAATAGADIMSIRLSAKGRGFVDAWMEGNEADAYLGGQ